MSARVVWLYEKPAPASRVLVVVAAVSLWGAWADTAWPLQPTTPRSRPRGLDPVTSGLVLGLTIAAMFLGHWYLNSPTMALEPWSGWSC